MNENDHIVFLHIELFASASTSNCSEKNIRIFNAPISLWSRSIKNLGIQCENIWLSTFYKTSHLLLHLPNVKPQVIHRNDAAFSGNLGRKRRRFVNSPGEPNIFSGSAVGKRTAPLRQRRKDVWEIRGTGKKNQEVDVSKIGFPGQVSVRCVRYCETVSAVLCFRVERSIRLQKVLKGVVAINWFLMKNVWVNSPLLGETTCTLRMAAQKGE